MKTADARFKEKVFPKKIVINYHLMPATWGFDSKKWRQILF